MSEEMNTEELARIVKTASDIATMQRDIHHLTQRMYEQSQQIQAQTTQIKALTETLGKINTVLSEAKGGWKTLMIAGTIGAGILGVAITIYNFIMKLKGGP